MAKSGKKYKKGMEQLRLKYLLNKYNITETELAAQMNTSVQYLNKLSNGHGNPTIGKLDAIAENLGVDFIDLFAKGNRPLDEFECPNCGKRLRVVDADDED